MAEFDRVIPILSPKHDLTFELDIGQEDIRGEESGICSSRTVVPTDEVKSFCEHLKNGGIIHSVKDGNEFTCDFFTRIVTVHSCQETQEYEFSKHNTGPIKRNTNIENDEKADPVLYFFSTDSQLCLVEESGHENREESAKILLNIFYVNFIKKIWLEYKLELPLQDANVYTVTMTSSQLLFYIHRPLKIIALEFSNVGMTSCPKNLTVTSNVSDVIIYRWESPDLNSFRILTCLNFVLLFTSQKDFTCLTFNKDKEVIEATIQRPSPSIREDYDEIVQLVNNNGKIFLIAQKESTLLFLQMKDSSFVISKKIDFKNLKCFHKSNPIIVKSMNCWKSSRLFIPLACMKSTFPHDDQVLSESLSIVDINLKTLSVTSVTRINSQVDIYQDIVYLTVLQHGRAMYVQKGRRYSSGKGSRVVSGHLMKLYAPTLRSVILLDIVNGVRDLSDIKQLTNSSRYLREQILQNYDF